MPRAYYNERDKKAAQHLRNAISAGLILDGDVDDRDVRDVLPSNLAGYDQHHFFAGIGIWSLALRWAGWPDDRPVWTGSCPCQPFSGAGKGLGFADERHVWPLWHWLIAQSGPDTIFGEQVASPDGLAWFEALSSDLEASGYAIGAGDLCSAGVGAPNIRQRLYWVAHAGRSSDKLWRGPGHQSAASGSSEGEALQQQRGRIVALHGGANGGLADADRSGHAQFPLFVEQRPQSYQASGHGGAVCAMGNAGLPHAEPSHADGARRREEGRAATEPSCPPDPWRELEWIECRDGKRRPTKPGLFPLAPRHPGDVGILRTAGNAINPYVAEAFIRAYLESE